MPMLFEMVRFESISSYGKNVGWAFYILPYPSPSISHSLISKYTLNSWHIHSLPFSTIKYVPHTFKVKRIHKAFNFFPDFILVAYENLRYSRISPNNTIDVPFVPISHAFQLDSSNIFSHIHLIFFIGILVHVLNKSRNNLFQKDHRFFLTENLIEKNFSIFRQLLPSVEPRQFKCFSPTVTKKNKNKINKSNLSFKCNDTQ